MGQAQRPARAQEPSQAWLEELYPDCESPLEESRGRDLSVQWVFFMGSKILLLVCEMVCLAQHTFCITVYNLHFVQYTSFVL